MTQISEILDRLARNVGGIGVAMLACTVAWVVFSRYALGVTPRWSEELPRLILVWVTVLGVISGFVRGSHFQAGIIDLMIGPGSLRRAIVYLTVADLAPMMVVAQRMIAGIDGFTLLAIPLFLLAGMLMVQGGLAPRIVNLCSALVGRMTGGLAIVMIAACMMFGSLSGSGVADVVAIGTMMLPAMKERGYHPGFSSAALGCAGSLGTVIPPSIVLIVYGTATNTSIGQLFVGAIIPGLLLGLSLMAVAWWISRKNGWRGGDEVASGAVGQALNRWRSS